MKHLLLTLFLSLLGCLGAKAQQTLSFVYDASGNRVARVIIINSIIATGEEPSEEERDEPKEFNEILGDTQIRLYPNPVESVLTISISSLEDKGKYAIFNMHGSLVLQGSFNHRDTKVEWNN
ncbi:T9SS type A sorting domain-containing protein [Porphyromonas sp. COT-052 OH4946]|uniref:T9SS type A sorting domain-containing protein n=1 Tax=Porphyromonas sp. COT-052 OH4946 TaxID=1515618 RepID=UPI000B0308AF|nr:T9SS type A sorting domain-containing protein [Porphyromonas sp. COT-052 OH4946]